MVARKTTRHRRSAEEARSAILDAAERQLIAVGPGAIRLQQVAAEVGVSHPTILHHFGSREKLIQAVVQRAFAALEADVLVALASGDGNADFGALFERVFAAFDAHGHGRALAWLALAGLTSEETDPRLREVVDTTYRRRLQLAPDGVAKQPKRAAALLEDTTFSVLLAVSALFAQSVIGGSLWRAMGLAEDVGSPARYRAWLAQVLVDRLAPK